MNDNSHHGKSLSESGQLKHHNLEILEALVATISAGINSKSSTAPLGCLLQILVVLLQEGGPLPGPKTGLLSNIQKWIVWGDTCAGETRDFFGKGHPGGKQEGKGTQENRSATGSRSLVLWWWD